MPSRITTLYHGSNAPIQRPDVAHNTGFADLGRGFYLTCDHDAACDRAAKRARAAGGSAVVSVFELDEAALPWAIWGERGVDADDISVGAPFGLRFDASTAGFAAWADYIKACRAGHTEVPDLGSPAVTRAWIATMEIEMVSSGFLDAAEFAQLVDPAELVVQYCMLDQDVLDRTLRFVRTESL